MMRFHGQSRCHGSDSGEVGPAGEWAKWCRRGRKGAPGERLLLPEAVMTVMVLWWQDGGYWGEAKGHAIKMEKRGIVGIIYLIKILSVTLW